MNNGDRRLALGVVKTFGVLASLVLIAGFCALLFAAAHALNLPHLTEAPSHD